jgi:hypothetical protein
MRRVFLATVAQLAKPLRPAGHPQIPGYELADRIVFTVPAQLRAIAHPLRDTTLDLLLERAATVG